MIRFGILDHDNHYAQRLVNFFSTRFGSQAEPHLFRSQQALLDYLKDNRLDLVLASTEQLPDPAVLPPKVLTAYLSEDADVEQINRCPAVFRYQRGEALLRRLKGLAAELDNRNATFASSKQGAVITFLGAGGGTGCTTAAVGCAAALAREGKKVLYLCLQNNGYVGDCLPKGGVGSMFRVLYEVKTFLGDRDRQGNLTPKLEGLLKYDTQLQISYYDAFPLPLEAASMTGEELELLLNTVSGLFDAVVADMDSLFSPLLRAILPLSDRVVLVSNGTQGINCRLAQMVNAFSLLDESDDLRVLAKTHVLYTRFGSQARQAQLPRSVPVLGAIDNFSGSDTRGIVAELAKRPVFRPLLDR